MANITSFVYQLVIYSQQYSNEGESGKHEMCRNLIFTTAVGLIKELDRYISAEYPKDRRPTNTKLTKLDKNYVLSLVDYDYIYEIRKVNFHPSKIGLIDFFNKYSVLRPLDRPDKHSGPAIMRRDDL